MKTTLILKNKIHTMLVGCAVCHNLYHIGCVTCIVVLYYMERRYAGNIRTNEKVDQQV